MINPGSVMDVPGKSVRKPAYKQQLSLRWELAGDAIAMARYHLAHDTASDTVSSKAEFKKLLTAHSIGDILSRLKDDVFHDEDLAKVERFGCPVGGTFRSSRRAWRERIKRTFR